MEHKLFPFQEQGVNFLTLAPTDPGFPAELDSPYAKELTQYNKLLADDMGLGKTVQVIAALDRIGAKSIVIVCPATVKIHWARKLLEWSKVKRSFYIVNSGRDSIPPVSVVIINYELLLRDRVYRQLLKRGEKAGFDAVVIDEAHYLKSISAKRTKRVLGKRSFIEYAKYRWLLTGTPVMNRPAELYPILYSLAPQLIEPFTSWKSYGEYFCAGYRDGLGYNFKGASHTAELAQRLQGFMLRRKKEDVLDELPDKIETIVELNCTCDFTIDDTHIATLRRELALAKIPEATRHITELLATVDKLVVFAHHRSVIESLADALREHGNVICYGGMSAEQKQTSVDDFIAKPDIKIFIAQTAAGGIGLDGLQAVCSHVLFIELDWSPGVMDQAVDRVRRIGQKRETIFVQYLAVPNSLDTQIGASLRQKRSVIEKLILANEVIIMSLESVLERIAIALEKRNAFDNGGAAALGSATEATQAEEKSTRGRKPAAKKEEPTVTNIPVQQQEVVVGDEPATPQEVNEALSRFIASSTDREGNKALIREVIYPQFGVGSKDEIKPEQRKELIAALEKGPSSYQAAKPADDLLGV